MLKTRTIFIRLHSFGKIGSGETEISEKLALQHFPELRATFEIRVEQGETAAAECRSGRSERRTHLQKRPWSANPTAILER